MVTSLIANSPAWMLTFARLAGMLGMNPLFARRNVPSAARAALVFLMTAILAPGLTVTLDAQSSAQLLWAMLKELFVGYVCGYVFQVFYYMLFFAGDLMDTHFGMSMAKVFDPGTSIQMSVSGSLLNILFILYIFITDSHLMLVRLFVDTFRILPLGTMTFSQDSARFMLDLFTAGFQLALQLVLPFMAAEFVLELAMGILMKLIPQIHIFVINIQFKMILGLLLLLAFASPTASFLDNYMRLMLENLQRAVLALQQTPA